MLYHKGIAEQLILERTGHRSLEGVGSYKRTDAPQQIAVSNVLQQNAGLQAQKAQQFPHQKPSTAVLSDLTVVQLQWDHYHYNINNNSSNTD